jgi:hypothetical protein
MRIKDLSRLRGAQNFDQREEAVRYYMHLAAEKREPIYISDLIVEEDVAYPLLKQLRDDRSKMYHLKVLKDKWGQTVFPGDIVKREFKKSLNKAPGTPRSAKELNASMRRGTWDQDFIRYEEFVVDKKGCITCSADDMWYFLSIFGIHSYSRQRISFHPHETSAGPQKMPNSKGMKHAHYWLYEEWDKEQYDAAPELKARETKDNKGK